MIRKVVVIKLISAFTLILAVTGLLACTTTNRVKTTEADTQLNGFQAYVSISSKAQAGQMQIVAIDDIPLGDKPAKLVPAGKHDISVACQLNNGLSATFNFNVDLLPAHSYCFIPRDPGASCTIVYTRSPWSSGGLMGC